MITPLPEGEYSGKVLNAAIRELQEEMLKLVAGRTTVPVVPLAMKKMTVDTSKPASWSESHKEVEEPIGTIAPFIRPDGTESDSMVLIKKERGWETAMIKDLDASTRDGGHREGDQGIAAQQAHLPGEEGRPLGAGRESVEPQS